MQVVRGNVLRVESREMNARREKAQELKSVLLRCVHGRTTETPRIRRSPEGAGVRCADLGRPRRRSRVNWMRLVRRTRRETMPQKRWRSCR